MSRLLASNSPLAVELGEPSETITPDRERAAELVFSAEDVPSLAETDARQPAKATDEPSPRIEPNLTVAARQLTTSPLSLHHSKNPCSGHPC